MADQEESSIIDFREMLWKARRYKWLVLLPIVVTLCGAWVYLTITPRLYESTVVISVDSSGPMSQALNGIVRTDNQSEDSRRERAQRVDSRVHSRPFLETIVNTMGYARDPAFLARAAAAAGTAMGLSSFASKPVEEVAFWIDREVGTTCGERPHARIDSGDRAAIPPGVTVPAHSAKRFQMDCAAFTEICWPTIERASVWKASPRLCRLASG